MNLTYIGGSAALSNLQQITLVHTNDLHSHLDMWPHTATVIRAELDRAAAAGRPATYVDAGDHMDMSDETTYGTRGRVNQRLLEAAGCAAFTLGNNEVLRLKLPEIMAHASASPFPWLGSNMRDLQGQSFTGLRDWTLLPVGPVRLGLLGIQPLGPAARSLGLLHVDAHAAIRSASAALRAAGADLVIHLSHMGIQEDQEVAGLGLGVDLIVGGHSHSVLPEPMAVGGIWIAQAGSFGQYVGVLNLTVDLDARRLTACEGRLVPVDPERVAADPEAVRLLAEGRRAAAEAMGEVLTVLPVDLPHDPLGRSQLAPYVAEALRRRAGAQIGLCLGGQAGHGFAAGPLTRSQIMEAMPPLFIPARLGITGRQLQALLEQSQEPEIFGRPLYDGGMRPRGRPVGRIFAAGLRYTVDPSMPPGQRVRDLHVGDAPVEPNRTYWAGAPSLLGFVESGYSAVEGVQILERYGPDFVRELFEEAVRDGLLDELDTEGRQ